MPHSTPQKRIISKTFEAPCLHGASFSPHWGLFLFLLLTVLRFWYIISRKGVRHLTKAKKFLKMAFFALACFAVLCLLVVLVVNVVVCASGKAYILTPDELAEEGQFFDCILVLGAGVKADGTPSDMLRDRLDVGVELYELNVSDRLLMSGDHMQLDYDEVGVMKRFAVDAGVPSEHVFLDHAGLSTYDSLYRVAKLYGVKKVLIVTQEYHLYRALYIARSLGMEAYGISASLRPYRAQVVRDVREVAARVKDVLLCIGQPPSTYLGASVDLSGNGNDTDRNALLEEQWQEQN